MVEQWQVIGTSVPGTAHIKHDLPCQDAHGFLTLSQGGVVVAVADGAGSASHAEQGALCAVQTPLALLKTRLASALPADQEAWETLLAQAFATTREALEKLAGTEAIPLRELATTLTLVIVTPTWLVTGQIGDGFAVAHTGKGELFACTEPQKGEFASETYFLTMDGALDHVDGRVYALSVAAIAVLTDGLFRLAVQLPANTPHPPFFSPLLAFPGKMAGTQTAQEQLAAFLRSERVNTRTDDDKTLVLAARTPHVVP